MPMKPLRPCNYPDAPRLRGLDIAKLMRCGQRFRGLPLIKEATHTSGANKQRSFCVLILGALSARK